MVFTSHFLSSRTLLNYFPGLKIKALIADPKSKNKGDGPLPVSYPPLPVISCYSFPFSFSRTLFSLIICYLYEQPMLYPHDLAAMPGAFPMPGYMPTSRQRLFVVHHKSVSSSFRGLCFSFILAFLLFISFYFSNDVSLQQLI